jgi:hypothetical protein
MDLREQRARAVQESIREILLREWDPIGVRDIPEAQDEYDGYVGGVYRLLANGASVEEIAAHLASIQRDSMGISSDAATLVPVARRLRNADIHLPPT